MGKQRNARSRCWATIIYPESAPKNFRDLIQEDGSYGFLSPLHDKDKKEDGTLKKPHYHFLLIQPNATVAPKVFFESIGGVGAERIASKEGYALYLCHTGETDKEQYDPADVQKFGIGPDYQLVIKGRTGATKDEIMHEMKECRRFIAENSIYSFRILCDVIDTDPDLAKWEVLINSSSYCRVLIEYMRGFDPRDDTQ